MTLNERRLALLALPDHDHRVPEALEAVEAEIAHDDMWLEEILVDQAASYYYSGATSEDAFQLARNKILG